MSNFRAPWRILLAAIGVFFVGTVGLAAFEQMSIGEAAYQTALILLTHFNHFDATDARGRLLVLALVISSLGLIAYLLKWFAEYMIGVGDNVRKRRLKAKIAKLDGHYIICGLGRVGSQIAREMAIEKVPFVALDRDNGRVEEGTASNYTVVRADSTSEQALLDAGVERAVGLIACLNEDSGNLLVTLTARALNEKLYIVARANRAENEVKLKRAGADRVAMPYQIGGYHMASMALRPSVVDYLDVVNSSGASTDLQVEEMVVGEHSKLAGHKLGRLVEDKVGATVIAINGSDGTSHVRPSGHETVYPGDRLIVLGSKSNLTKASDLVR